MKTRTVRFFLKIFFVLACCTGIGVAAQADEVIIGTGATAVENIFKKIEFPLSRARGIKLNIVISDLVQTIKDLDAGKVHCAVGGLSFVAWMELMKQNGYDIPDPSVYNSWVIGQDSIRVMTNLDVSVAALSKEQLMGIFSGTITNWSEVGGPDKPILVVMGSKVQGAVTMFRKNIMGTTPFTKNATMGTTAEDIKSRIIRNPGAIGFGTISQIDYLVNSPVTPEIKRPITLVSKRTPPDALLKMIEYINKDGQRYIVQ
jgi:ABC-type phosphate transport system, periplasmic component